VNRYLPPRTPPQVAVDASPAPPGGAAAALTRLIDAARRFAAR